MGMGNTEKGLCNSLPSARGKRIHNLCTSISNVYSINQPSTHYENFSYSFKSPCFAKAEQRLAKPPIWKESVGLPSPDKWGTLEGLGAFSEPEETQLVG